MDRTNNSFIASLSFALLVFLASPAWAQIDVGDYTISGSAEVGGLPRHKDGKDAKFEEYRDLPESVIVPELQLIIGGKKEDFYLTFDAGKVGRDDQNYNLRFGRYGLLDVQFEWDQIPHLFSRNTAMTPFASSNGGGTLTVDRTNTPIAFPLVAGQNTCGTSPVCQWLTANQHPIELSLLDRMARLKLRYTPSSEWTFTGNYWSNNSEGKRALGALNGYSSSTMNISELAEPINYQTHNVELGGEYTGNGWNLGVKYNASLFHNNVSTLVWDNPLHVLSGGNCLDSITYSNANGTGSCQGRMDLYPSNQAHTFTLTGTATLPMKTRFLGTVSYGWRLQDDSFLPFTINRCYGSGAVDPTKCSDGALTAMPTISKNSLNGDVRPLMVNTTLVNNSLIDRLNLKAYYRLFDLANHSNTVIRPQGMVGNDRGTLVSASPILLASEPPSYSKNTAGMEAGYNFTRWLTGKFNYTWDKIHRTGWQTINSSENSIGPTLDIKPNSWLLFRANYKRSWRTSDGDTTADQMVFLEGRNQNKVSLFTDISPWETLSFHGGFDFTGNTFSSQGDLGVQDNTNYSPSVGFLYAPLDWLRVFGDYNWDLSKWKLVQRVSAGSCSLATATGCKIFSDGKDKVNTFSLGSDLELIKNILGFRIQYTFSEALSEIGNRCNAACNAPNATDYPNTISLWHELLARFEYQMHKNVALRFGYFFNALRGKDYGVDIMKTWMGDISSPGDSANSLASQQRSIFLGDQIKGPFTAHVGFISLKFKF